MLAALTLVSALLHASWNALLRREPDKDRGLTAAIIAAAVVACAVALVRWALGAQPFTTPASILYTVLAGLFEAIYFSTLARALEVGRLGVVYTVSRGGAVLVVWPASLWLFAEVVTWTSGTGSAVVLAGLVVSSLSVTTASTRAHRAGVGWAAACAVSIAGYHLAYKAGVREGANPSALFGASLALSAVLSVIRLGRAGRRTLVVVVRERGSRVALMGLLCGGSFLILMEAISIGGSAFVLTLRNTSVLFAVILAAMIGERPQRTEIVGAILVAGGAVLMSV